MTASITPDFVHHWHESLVPVSFTDLAADPGTIAIFSADLINGFVHDGPLASPRVHALIPATVELLNCAWNAGVRNFVLLQDTHPADSPEFMAYPPHAIAGTTECQTIPELASLPFADHLTIIEKRSLNPAIATGFDAWLDSHPEVSTAVVIGDCTDLCVYQLAMHLRMRANALGIQDFDVIVPTDVVDTFDIPVNDDGDDGLAHPGDFFHEVFLYHMASNGIRVVSSMTDDPFEDEVS